MASISVAASDTGAHQRQSERGAAIEVTPAGGQRGQMRMAEVDERKSLRRGDLFLP